MPQIIRPDDIASFEPAIPAGQVVGFEPPAAVIPSSAIATFEPPAAPVAAGAFTPDQIRPMPAHGAPLPVAARPAPIAAQGITDPASVRVTDPIAVHGFTDAATSSVTDPWHLGPSGQPQPGLAPQPTSGPVVGIPQIGRGLSTLAGQMRQPPGTPTPEGTMQPPLASHANVPGTTLEPDPTTAAENAGSDIIEGLFQTAQPLILGATVANPLAAAPALVKTMLAGKFGQAAAAALGASEAGQRLTSNVAALLAGGVSAQQFADQASASARALVLAGKLAAEPLRTMRPVGAAATVAEAVGPAARPGAHAPLEAIDAGTPSSVQLPPGSGPAETLTDIVRTALAPEPAPLNTQPASTPEAAAARLQARDLAIPPNFIPGRPFEGQDLSALTNNPRAIPVPPVIPASDVVAVEPPAQEPNDAVSQQSGAAVDVRQPSSDGAALGGRNPEPAQPAGAGAIPADQVVAVEPPVAPQSAGPGQVQTVQGERPPAPGLSGGEEGPRSDVSHVAPPAAPRPVTPQLPAPTGGYVLPGFVTAPYVQPGAKAPLPVKPKGPRAEATPAASSELPEQPPAAAAPATPEPAAATTAPALHVRAYQVLTRALEQGFPAFPKHAGEFRAWLAPKLGVTREQLMENPDVINDAAEAALAHHMRFLSGTPDERLRGARLIEGALPRAHRTLEKLKLQQFSTPLPIAELATRAAQVQDGDIVLEPTAGTGNLVAPLAGRHVSIVAHELAERRADLLEAQGHRVVRGDYLREKSPIRADVIITNPPWGKYSKGIYGAPVGLDFAPRDVAERFIAKNLRDLAPDGRLVAVMPTTMLESPVFKRWLQTTHTVQAIIQSPPGAYDTRATSVDSVLLVVDKVPPAAGAALPAVVVTKDWSEYAAAVDGVPHRAARVSAPEGNPASAARPPGGRLADPLEGGVHANQPAAAGGVSGAQGVRHHVDHSNQGRPPDAARPAAGSGADGVRERPRSDVAEPRPDAGVGTGRDAELVAAPAHDAGGERPVVENGGAAPRDAAAEPAGEFADVTDHAKDERAKAAGSRQFAPYLRRTDLRGVGHPKLIVEARNLAGVPYPALTLKPGQAILTALAEKRVSVEQAEQALAALQANLTNHHGYLAADNVGVGKSRELALVILELMERAKADDRPLRLIVTTKSADNIVDLIDSELYYVATGRTRDGRDLADESREKVIPQALDFDIVKTTEWPDAKREGQEYKPLPKHPRAIYISDFYNLASFRQALADIEPHGIIGDEAHRFKNVDGAAAGGAWQNLHAVIMRGVPRPHQVFAYFTATPAQSVYDYQYLYGLRLWPIDGFADWVNLVTGHANEAAAKALAEATEKGAKNLNAITQLAGASVVGTDSEDTAKGDRKNKFGPKAGSDVFAAKLTPAEAEQIPREWKMQGRFSARDLWRDGQEFTIHEATLPAKHAAKYNEFIDLAHDIMRKAYQFGLLDKTGKSSRFGVTGQLQFAAKRIQMQPALEEAITLAKGKVAGGYQVVLSVINVEEMDSEKGNIAAAIKKINTRVKDVDPDDPEGGVIDGGEIPEALIAQAELLERAKKLGVFDDPKQLVIDAFGADKVAFIVGSSPSARRVAMREFQQGLRPVAFLSGAGTTGINLDHRVWTKGGARGRRLFIDVQYEWSATESIQRYGRVGRSASITQPVIMPLTFGNASEKKFLATIANRMAALGALSKGGADTTGASGLEEFEILGPEANHAARLAYEKDLDRDEKREFAVVKSVFRSPNRGADDPFEPIDVAPSGATMKDFQLALLLVPLETSNKFWRAFVQHREDVRELLGHQTQSRSDAFTGEVLRATTLRPDLTLYEVKNQVGHKFGVLSGVITPRMPLLRDFLYTADDPDGAFSRKYVTFSAGAQIVSGLQVPISQVKRLAESFGHVLASEKLDTPAKVRTALHAGDRVALQNEPWALRERKDGKIVIDGAVMADRTLLLNNGGAYSPVGNFWFVKEDRFDEFVTRFPAKAPAKPTKPAAQAMRAGERTVANAAVVPGAKEFLEQDVTPTLRATAAHVDAARRDLRAIFAPDTASQPGRVFGGIMRSELAAHTQRVQRAQKLLHEATDAFKDMAGRADGGQARAKGEFLAFVDVMEGEGSIADLPPWQQPHAKLFRDLLDSKRSRVQRDTGRLRTYIEHYFPHEWAKPGLARQALLRMLGRRPLGGDKGFLKHRSIPKTREGVAAGLVPASWNPAELVLHKLVQMDKFLIADYVLQQAKQLGVAKMIRLGKKHPEGWQRYHDTFGTVWGPPVIQVSEAYDAGLMEALHTFATSLGVDVVTKVNAGGGRWAFAIGAKHIVRRLGGPEGALMHEIGHVLDTKFGLGKTIGLAQASERREEVNFDEVPGKVGAELRQLADLRTTKTSSDSFKRYVRQRDEQIANLVHAFLYVPEQAKTVAPNAYWALYNLAKDTPALHGLLDVQRARSLRLAERTLEHHIDGARIMGHYYGPPDAVRLLNHYLSPGLRGNSLLFDLYRVAGNALNQVQLGLSWFHLTMVSLEAVISKSAEVLQRGSRGDLVGALKTLPQVPVAPILNLVKGHRYLKELYEADANGRTFDDVTGLIIQGGGGVGWSKFFHEGAPAQFMRTLRSVKGAAETGNYPGAAVRLGKASLQTLPTVIELWSMPVMEWFVPRLKLGAYIDLARMELETLGPTPSLTEVRRVLGNTWDNIDNRFGELRYDNLFWHNALKDLGMASVRALGFTLGTTREVFGAPTAQLANLGLLPKAGGAGSGGGGRRPTRLVNTGTDPEGRPQFTHVPEPWLHSKFAYLISLLWIAGLIGGIYHYTHTGERPKELRDYFFPKTGRKRPDGTDERVSLPGYFKDLYHVLRDLPGSALETAAGKMHPGLGLLVDLLENEDYFGVQIRNPDDPAVVQLQQVFEHLVEEARPITLRNLARERETFGHVDTTRAVESFFGITPAPQTVSRTNAEEVLHTIQRRRGMPTLTRDQGAARDAKRDIRRDAQRDRAAGVGAARDAVTAGTLTNRQAVQAVKQADQTYLERGVKALTLDDALDVYEAATPAERRGLAAIMAVKVANAQPPAAKAAALRARLQAARALPIADAPKARMPVAAR